MDGKIVLNGKTKDEADFLIRYPVIKDAKAMLDYINTISKEQTFISYQGEQLTLEEEEEFLKSRLKKIEEREGVLLLVFSKNKVIGIGGIDMKPRVENHVGLLGISLLADYRGQGIGKTLMQTVLDEGKSHIAKLRIVMLSVLSNNTLAFDMYKKFGFIKYGNLPKGVTYRGEYVDHIYMYKEIR